MAVVMTTGDVQAREAATLVERMADAATAMDAEIGAVLRTAQRELEALSWNRYAASMSRQSTRRRFIRRHGALLAQRTGH